MYLEHEGAGPRRVAAIAATAAIHGVIAAGLIWGLSVADGDTTAPDARVLTVDVTEPPPPVPPPPPAPEDSAPAEQPPAPSGVKGEALPREAPKVAVPLVTAPAATVAGDGRDANAGAGSEGTGTGAGGSGTGGGGGGGGIATPAERIAGAVRDSDYPRNAPPGAAGTVAISFRVRTDGRVDRCIVTGSSGHPVLDNLTCQLFTQRYRFRPAMTAKGAPVESTLRTSFTWGTRRR